MNTGEPGAGKESINSPILGGEREILDHEEEESPKYTKESIFFSCFLIIFEVLMVLIYVFLVESSDNVENPFARSTNSTIPPVQKYYPMYMDVAMMIFPGFGMLMAFLKKHAFYALGMTVLISCMVIQLSIVCVGYSEMIVESIKGESTGPFYLVIDIPLLVKSLFCCGATLISMGIVMGKFTPSQLMLMAFSEVIFYSINVALVEGLLETSDVGGSMLIHAFGAYFGVACSWISLRIRGKINNTCRLFTKELASTTGDSISIIGTMFLFILWPSFNSVLETEHQVRVIINTFLSLTASCVAAYAFSRLFRKKFGMCDIQNATIAGGVAIGSSSNMLGYPGISILIGFIAGTICCIGFRWITPFLKKIHMHDTCGVHNLHGMPGLFGGFCSIFMSISMKDLPHGKFQPLIQIAGLAISFTIASFGGFFTGLVLRFACYPEDDAYFEDGAFFFTD